MDRPTSPGHQSGYHARRLPLAVLAVFAALWATHLSAEQPAAAQPPARGTQPPPTAAPRSRPPLARQPAPSPEPSETPQLDTAAADDFQFGSFLTANRGASLASAPAMFGDSFFRGADLTLVNMPTVDSSVTLTSDLPLAGATRRVLVAEHNKALPVDRVYFNYNHFHNALDASTAIVSGPGMLTSSSRDFSVNQYTLGWEKAFHCNQWSAEVRFPLAGSYGFDFASPGGLEAAAVSGGEVGNLAVIVKRVLYNDGATVVSAGVGFDLPTGDDAEAATAATGSATRFSLKNEAVYVLPYLAAMGQPNPYRFWHAFAQLDVPLNSHEFQFSTAGVLPPAALTGEWHDQTLLHLDVGGGVWLCRSPCSRLLTGVAAIAELHYTTALDDTDVVAAAGNNGVSAFAFDLRSAANRIDVINLTAGLHFELSRVSSLRVAAAVPLRETDNRWFDSELLVQFARAF